MNRASCLLCGRELSVESDPLSLDCGGDCLACVREMEADAAKDVDENGQES